MSAPDRGLGIGLKLSRGAPIESFRRVWHISCSGADPVRAAEVAAEKILPTIRQL